MNAADGVVLFDESKKKQSVNCVDLLMQLIKLARDSQIFTFTNPHLQNKITKVIKSKGELCFDKLVGCVQDKLTPFCFTVFLLSLAASIPESILQ